MGETPGPIPNPEAKTHSADGTAPGRVWESRTPPDNHYPGAPGWAPTPHGSAPTPGPLHLTNSKAGILFEQVRAGRMYRHNPNG